MMKVKREAVTALVMALVLTVVLIGVAGAKVVSPLATDEQGMITNLHMSDSCEGADMILFPAGTETVYLIFDYSNLQGEEWRIRVENSVTLYDTTVAYTGSDTECITITHTGPIPPGAYGTTIYAGEYPSKFKLWHVRSGGPGEITSLHMSLSPDGLPRTQFVEGVRTLWAVFDYADMEGNEVGIDVYQGDTGLPKGSRVSLTGSGTKAISTTHYLVAGFPPGQYRTHVLKDEFVDAIEDWAVWYGAYLPLVLKSHP